MRPAWTSVRLVDLVEDIIGGLWGDSADSATEDSVEVSVVRASDFRNWNDRRASEAAHRRIPDRFLSHRELMAGDLVLEVSGGSPAQPVGRALVVDERALSSSSRPLICSNFCRKVRLKPNADPYFVKQQLDVLYESGHTDQFQTSTTNIRNLQVAAFLAGTRIVLPDLVTQRRLVGVIDKSSVRVSVGATHIIAARRAIERFRQSVLASACSGRLTEVWRLENPRLRIRLDAPSSPRAAKVLAAFGAEKELFELPDSWQWAPLAVVSDSILGKMLDQAKNQGELQPYLRNINVRWRHFDLSDLQQMRFEHSEEERYGLRQGDVVVCEGGEPGRAAVWQGPDSRMKIQKALHRVRCHPNLLPAWLVDVLQAHSYSGVLAEYFTGTGISHLTGVSLARLPIPLPPVEEQEEIVRRVEQSLSLAETLEGRLGAALRQVERSSPAILGKAFRGGLVGGEDGA